MTVEHARLKLMRAETARIRDLVDDTHQIVVTAKKLLSGPVPDTFVGRRTHEPFPRETMPKPIIEAKPRSSRRVSST